MTVIASRPRQGTVAYLTFISIVSALGGLLFGFDTVVISGTLAPLKAQFTMSAAMEGWLVSSALLGSAMGAAASGAISDRFGRRPVLILSGVLLAVCSVGCAFAWDLNVLVLARWIGGLGVGLTSLASPLYISEISTARLRGRMVTLFQFAITLGICLALLSNSWLEHLSAAGTGSSGRGFYHFMVVDEVWRGMFGMEFFPAAAFLTLCFIIPEAPRWLVKVGRMSEAMSVLKRVGEPEAARFEMQEIQSAVSAETGSLTQLFQPGLRKALFVALFLAIASELSGITVVFYYGPSILEQAGFSLGNALGGFVSIGLLNMLFTIVAIWLMDIAGRRVLLFTGTAGACVALTMIGELFRTGHVQGTALVGMMCLFVACFAFSMGPIKWVIMSEIFPTKIRGRAMAIATLAVWVTDGIYNQFFPVLRDSLGVASTFFIFALALIPQFFFIWKIMPETKGQTLEMIERFWIREASLKD